MIAVVTVTIGIEAAVVMAETTGVAMIKMIVAMDDVATIGDMIAEMTDEMTDEMTAMIDVMIEGTIVGMIVDMTVETIVEMTTEETIVGVTTVEMIVAMTARMIEVILDVTTATMTGIMIEMIVGEMMLSETGETGVTMADTLSAAAGILTIGQEATIEITTGRKVEGAGKVLPRRRRRLNL